MTNGQFQVVTTKTKSLQSFLVVAAWNSSFLRQLEMENEHFLVATTKTKSFLVVAALNPSFLRQFEMENEHFHVATTKTKSFKSFRVVATYN